MPPAPLLPEAEIHAALADLPHWRRDGGWLIRAVRLPTFRDAIALVNAVADAAEEADHHPDIEVVWRTVTFRLTTKVAGGITQRDLRMARSIDRLAG